MCSCRLDPVREVLRELQPAGPPCGRPAVVLICLVAWCGTGPAVLAAEPIDTDGPDFAESSEVVGRARFQYEADVQVQHNRRTPSNDTISTPALIKYGITDDLELRLETEGRIWVDSKGVDPGVGSIHGNGDTAVGIKWHSQDRDAVSGQPAVSWILHFDTPSGSSGLKGQGIRPSLRSVVSWELPRDFALGIMPGIKYDSDDGHRYASGIFGAVLNRHLNESTRAFVELSAVQISHARYGGTTLFFDVGAAHLLDNDTQLGVRLGVGANATTPSSYVLVELAQRF